MDTQKTKVRTVLQKGALPIILHSPELQELLPGIINQLGPDNLANLKKIAESYTQGAQTGATKEDEDVPELVENFEAAAEKESPKQN